MPYKNRLFIKSKKFQNTLIPILFILSFLLVFFNKTDYTLVYKLKSSGIDFINPISKTITYPIYFTVNLINNFNYLRLAEIENKKLKKEIIRLKKWQTLALKNNMENSAYKKLLNSTNNSLNIIKTAAISQYSPNFYSKSIVINAGSNYQLEQNYPVINERGLVGKIILVTKNNSTVLLINDQNSSIPVKSHNRDFYAILEGSSDGKYLVSSFIKDNKKPLVGDILVTSGNVDIFPNNILVGKVVSVLDGSIRVLPFVDLKNIEFVQIIKNN